MTWAQIWGAVFAATIVVYTVLVAVVTVGGWKDIRAMLSKLDENEKSDS